MTTPTVEQPDDQHSPSRWRRWLTPTAEAATIIGLAFIAAQHFGWI